jgi:hypothetical protein
MPCSLVDAYSRFRESCCCNLRPDDVSNRFRLKVRYTSTRPHGVTFQMTCSEQYSYPFILLQDLHKSNSSAGFCVLLLAAEATQNTAVHGDIDSVLLPLWNEATALKALCKYRVTVFGYYSVLMPTLFLFSLMNKPTHFQCHSLSNVLATT